MTISASICEVIRKGASYLYLYSTLYSTYYHQTWVVCYAYHIPGIFCRVSHAYVKSACVPCDLRGACPRRSLYTIQSIHTSIEILLHSATCSRVAQGSPGIRPQRRLGCGVRWAWEEIELQGAALGCFAEMMRCDMM